MVIFRREDLTRSQRKPFFQYNLQVKMIGLIGALTITIIGVIALFLHNFLSDLTEKQIGSQALDVAETVARIPEVQEAFSMENPESIINPIVTSIRKATGAEYIVIGNREEIRYAHPNVHQIGLKMVGEDNERALVYGESYTSKAVGSLGSALRAKVPIYDGDEIVGVVSVGFLTEDIQSVFRSSSANVWLVLLVIAGVSVIGAMAIATYIKNRLYGMEPEEIANLLFQKETILQSTHEGILAVNEKSEITMLNTAAEALLFQKETEHDQYVGKKLKDLPLESSVASLLFVKKNRIDREMIIGNEIVFVNSVPIFYEDVFLGTVSTIRNKSEIVQLTNELMHVQQYANALRAQTHEFSNKLYLILGLLQLGKKQEAMATIQKESELQHHWIRLCIDKVHEPLISGILLGKMNYAQEKAVQTTIHHASSLTVRLSERQVEALVVSIGNIIDNAIDALQNQSIATRQLTLFFTHVGKDIVIEIEDSGPGISPSVAATLFDQGVTTKKGVQRGIGLTMSKQLIEQIGGVITIEESELGGVCFVISIPKNEENDRATKH